MRSRGICGSAALFADAPIFGLAPSEPPAPPPPCRRCRRHEPRARVISEIAPKGSMTACGGDGVDDGKDWIELHNPTDSAVNLHGWVVYDQDGKWRGTVIGQVTIAPQEYLLLCHQKSAAWDPAKNFNFGVSGAILFPSAIPTGTSCRPRAFMVGTRAELRSE